ncbi:hypothetical protein KYB31_22750 [Clostridium felsineum]|nr:hypothetical protein [Clostridium felsineum]MCR3761797.1 hypothetical protein [Clostridium felsineum]
MNKSLSFLSFGFGVGILEVSIKIGDKFNVRRRDKYGKRYGTCKKNTSIY